MRSHSSHSSHRSHSSHSSHRSSLSHRNHSSLSRSMSSRRSSISGSRLHSHHGISNAHAFAVGKATGININGSAMGAHGAALHRSSTIRHRSSLHRSSTRRNRSTINKTNSILRNIRLSQDKKRYKASRIYYDNFERFESEFRAANYGFQKYMWIPILMFFIVFISIFVFIFNQFMQMRMI